MCIFDLTLNSRARTFKFRIWMNGVMDLSVDEEARFLWVGLPLVRLHFSGLPLPGALPLTRAAQPPVRALPSRTPIPAGPHTHLWSSLLGAALSGDLCWWQSPLCARVIPLAPEPWHIGMAVWFFHRRVWPWGRMDPVVLLLIKMWPTYYRVGTEAVLRQSMSFSHRISSD